MRRYLEIERLGDANRKRDALRDLLIDNLQSTEPFLVWSAARELAHFTKENGGTRVVPGSHQRSTRPTDDYCAAHAVDLECPAGTMIVFDSTLWHAAGANTSKSAASTRPWPSTPGRKK